MDESKVSKLNDMLQNLSQLVKDNPNIAESLRQSDFAKTLGDSLKNYGGIVDLNWANDEENSDFSFPFNFAATYERLSRNPVVGKILYSRQSKLELGDWTLSFKDKDLLNDPHHKFVLDYLHEQIENAGGMTFFIKKNVLPALKFGVSAFAPTYEIETRTFNNEELNLTKIDNFFWYHPAYMFRVFMDSEDLNRVASMQYWIPDKATVTFDVKKDDIKNLRETVSKDFNRGEKARIKQNQDYIVERIVSDGGKLVLTDIDFKMRMGGVISYNSEGSNPIGRSYIYLSYSLALAVDEILQSLIKALRTIGLHSLQVLPIASDREYDENSMLSVQKALETLRDKKGGIFISSTHKIEPIPATEVQYIPQLLDSLFMLMSRLNGESIDSLGVGSSTGLGGSGAAESMQKNLTPELYVDAVQLCFGLNKTFARYFTDMNFGHWVKMGLLKQYPVFEWSESKELSQTIKPTNQQGQEQVATSSDEGNGIDESSDSNSNELLSTAASTIRGTNGQGVDINANVNNNGITTKKTYVKRDPKGTIEKITIDIEDMEMRYLSTENLIKDRLKMLLRSEVPDIIKRTKGDAKKIEKEIKKLHTMITKELKDTFNMSSSGFANMFFDMMGKSSEFLSQGVDGTGVVDKTVKALEKQFTEKANLAAINLGSIIFKDITDTLSRGVGLVDKDLIDFAVARFSADDQYNYTAFVRDLVMYESEKVSSEITKKLIASGNTVAVIRSAILEGSCSHCIEYDGVIYYIDENGNKYNKEGIPYHPLPDRECLGTKNGHTCRCTEYPINAGLVEAANMLGE